MVDKYGKTMDLLLTEQRDEQAAKRFLTKAIRRHGVPETSTIDGSAAHDTAITSYNAEHGTVIAIRKSKYLNNIVEQDPRAVKPEQNLRQNPFAQHGRTARCVG